jgi:hypothetical protein
LIILCGEEFKLWSSSSCSFLYPSVISSLLGTNILQSTLFSNQRLPFDVYLLPLMSETKFHTYTKLQQLKHVLLYYFHKHEHTQFTTVYYECSLMQPTAFDALEVRTPVTLLGCTHCSSETARNIYWLILNT